MPLITGGFHMHQQSNSHEVLPFPAEHAASEAVTTILRFIGEDPSRDGLLDTPARVLKAWREMTSGYADDPAEILARTFEESSDEMVVLRGISFHSTCEHHLLPFYGEASVGYLPGKVAGISKLARLVDCFARRLQIQERLTRQIAESVEEDLAARGVGGIVAGDTVRCPLHHACYDLRTGAATAPALAPTPVWNVEQHDGRVFVTTKREIPPTGPIKTNVSSVGIVGAGVAGNAAAETLRREGFTGTITMIGAEETVPIDRPNLSKEYLAGSAPEEWMPLRDAEFYRAQNIEFLMGRRAVLLDAKTKTLTFDDHSTRTFDAILLATGSEPVRLSPPGAARVHVLRTLRDSRAIIAEAAKGKRAVVLGASFIGLEVAASLRAREVEVTVVAPDEVPLGKTMGAELGGFIRRLHEEHGVRFRLGTTAATFEGDRVILATGEPLLADFVVAGVGVRPNTQLAQIGGLAVDHGIIVDEFLLTSAPGIYAAGDVAHYPDRFSGQNVRVEHWVAAGRQGQTAALNILGRPTPHTATPFFWSAHYDVTSNSVGNAAG